MKQRIVTAIIAATLFIPLLYIGGVYFHFLLLALGLISLSEMFNMKGMPILSPEGGVTSLAMVAIIWQPHRFFSYLPSVPSYLLVVLACLLALLILTVFRQNVLSYESAGAFFFDVGLCWGRLSCPGLCTKP